MSRGILLVSLLISLLMSIGLYHLICFIVTAGKFILDKASDVGGGIKASGKVFGDAPKKALDVTKHGAKVSNQWIRDKTPKIKKVLGGGIRKSTDVVKEKAPIVGKAISVGTQRTIETVQISTKKATKWSKEEAPQLIRNVKNQAAMIFKKMTSLFKKGHKKDDKKD